MTTLLRPIAEWRETLREAPPAAEVHCATGRDGRPTLKIGNVLLHSRYNPEQEAHRLIDSAELDSNRPVLVIGAGLGYHVLELLNRGFEVAVAEPRAIVAKHAVEGPLAGAACLLAVGETESITGCTAFQAFARRMPQVLIHPATTRVTPEYADHLAAAVSVIALGGQHLSVAVVGPMYGGSLPIARYLARAMQKLGHRALFVDNSQSWKLYDNVRHSIETPRANAQLTNIYMNFLSEWTYARVAEFNPEICIVLAQAPVSRQFPLRLAQKGIVTAFWFVENWRHMPYWKDLAPQYDYFFHIQPGEFDAKLDEIGVPNHAFVQTACDPEEHVPVKLTPEETKDYACDLSFAGAGYYNRLQVFRGLTDFNFKIWGVDWDDPALARRVVGGERRFESRTFMKIVAGSKINLNLHASKTHPGIDPACDAVNPRVFEIAAAGGFQLCDPCAGLGELFDLESELPAYRSLKELRDRITYFLAHPEERCAVAERAQNRVLRDHTYERRAAQMLDLILERHGVRMLKRGIRIQRTVAEMAGEAGVNAELGEWLATLPPETPFVHEDLLPFTHRGTQDSPYPARVFRYINEVKEFADTILRLHK